MAISQPVSTDKLNSPDHSLMHRQIATDPSAPVQSLTISSTGNLGGTCLQNTNPTNLLSNGDFENWSAGTSVAPDGWTLQGAGASVAREATIIDQGLYSAKITRAGTDCYLNAAELSAAKGLAYWKGKTVTYSCKVYATVASRARLSILTTPTTYSSFHTGDSTWQKLSVTCTIDNAATYIYLLNNISGGDTSAYFDGAMCVEGESAFAFADNPKPLEGIWTPGISFGGATTGITYAGQGGSYIKIGKLVHVSGYVGLSSNGSASGAARITGLPFAIAAGTGNYAAPSLRFTSVSFANQTQGYGEVSDTKIVLEEITEAGTMTSLVETNFADNAEIFISFTYHAAA